MTEDGRKHLEFIQQVVARMNTNSFQLRGWSVTLVAGLFALAVAEANKTFALLAIVPIVVFWILDAYYLWTERRYRRLYNHLRDKSDDDLRTLNSEGRLYAMELGQFAIECEPPRNVALWGTVPVFHGSLLVTCAILFVSVFLLMGKSKSVNDATRKLNAAETAALASIEDERKRVDDAVTGTTADAKRKLDAAETSCAAILSLETDARSHTATINALADQLSHVGDLQMRLVKVEALLVLQL